MWPLRVSVPDDTNIENGEVARSYLEMLQPGRIRISSVIAIVTSSSAAKEI